MDEEGQLYILTEFINGGDISKAIDIAMTSSVKNNQARGLSEKIARRAALHIVSALSEFHSKGIVHRDVKSKNVMVHHSDGSARKWDKKLCLADPISYFY